MAVPVLDLVVTLCERFQFPSLTGNSFLSSLSGATVNSLRLRSIWPDGVSTINIRTWSTCWWDHSSWHRLTACGDPNLCIVRYSWQISCTMSQIKVLLLFWSLFLVQLSEGFQINPLWYEHLVCQRDWSSKPSSHAQFCWTKITPRQRSCSVTQ